MKLAFCLFKYFPFGGLQRDFLRIAKECLLRGHEVHVLTMQWEGDTEGLIVHRVPVSGLQNHTRKQSFVHQIRGTLNQYDLVVGFNKMPHLDIYYAADTCYQAKARLERSFGYRLLPRYRHNLYFERAVFSKNNLTDILILSSVQQAEFVRYYQTPVSRFHLLPPGIARDRMAPPHAAIIRQRLRAQRGLQEDEFLLLLVGSGFKTKGLDRVLHGMASLPPSIKNRTRLIIIGQDRAASFQRLAHTLQVRSLQFLGGRHDVPEFLLAADILLHPAYNENTGTVLLEAMASGLPVLTTDVCGYAHYVVQAKAGMVLPAPFEQQAFDAALLHMLMSKEERKTWQKNAIHFTQNADIYSLPQRAADHIEAIYDKKKINSYSFEYFMSLKGQVYRELEKRRTSRIEIAQEAYFIKQHFGVGWREILKNLLLFRLPVLSAKNEFIAINRLKALGIGVPQIAAFGLRGWNPAAMHSFLLTHELGQTISLEMLSQHWREVPPAFCFKKRLIKAVAHIARTMHEHGINHRDFYICHFLLDQTKIEQAQLYIIDLHRAQCRKNTPMRWIIKDLAGLYFSSQDIGLTRRDLFHFMREYRKLSLRDFIHKEAIFWKKVKKRGDTLYKKQHSSLAAHRLGSAL